jgi:hypothetical protein
MAKFL